MQVNLTTYDRCNWTKRFGTLCCIVLFQAMLYAQTNEKVDTVPVLKYELDTTATPTLPEEEPPAEETYGPDESADVKDKAEYFLRKEFTGGFSDSIIPRRLPDSVVKDLREDDAFWYANEVFKRQQPKQRTSIFSHPLFQTFLWVVIIAGFVTFLILYLANSNVGLFRSSSNLAPDAESVDTNDIFSINYQREIEKAVAMSEYRLAIRLMFLRLLKDLADHDIIQYKQDSTNLDYLMQMQSTGMYPDFFRLTRNYEYSWYGQFDVDKEKFVVIKKEFDNFDRKYNRD